MPEATVPVAKYALLDTSVQIDRVKMEVRQRKLKPLLDEYDETICTGISLLEFKAVVIAECIFIFNCMRREGARFTEVRDNVLESQSRQAALRRHIFDNMIDVVAGASFDIDEKKDKELAQEAADSLENHIPYLYEWFKKKSADTYLNAQAIKCTRADEEPRKLRKAFSTTLPTCKYKVNRHCRVEDVIREKAASLLPILDSLDASDEDNSQLLGAKSIIESVVNDEKKRLSVSDCRGAGDCLIAMEGAGIAHHALSTNARDWRHVAPAVGMKLRHIKYQTKHGMVVAVFADVVDGPPNDVDGDLSDSEN